MDVADEPVDRLAASTDIKDVFGNTECLQADMEDIGYVGVNTEAMWSFW